MWRRPWLRSRTSWWRCRGRRISQLSRCDESKELCLFSLQLRGTKSHSFLVVLECEVYGLHAQSTYTYGYPEKMSALRQDVRCHHPARRVGIFIDRQQHIPDVHNKRVWYIHMRRGEGRKPRSPRQPQQCRKEVDQICTYFSLSLWSSHGKSDENNISPSWQAAAQSAIVKGLQLQHAARTVGQRGRLVLMSDINGRTLNLLLAGRYGNPNISIRSLCMYVVGATLPTPPSVPGSRVRIRIPPKAAAAAPLFLYRENSSLVNRTLCLGARGATLSEAIKCAASLGYHVRTLFVRDSLCTFMLTARNYPNFGLCPPSRFRRFRFLAILRAAETNRLQVATSPLLFTLFRRLVVRYNLFSTSRHPRVCSMFLQKQLHVICVAIWSQLRC